LDPDPLLVIVFDHLEITVQLLLLGVLLLCSALISGSEIAFFSLSTTDLEEHEKEHQKSSQLISTLLEKPKKLLATILVANNFINIAIVLLADTMGAYFFDHLSYELFLGISIRFILEVILVTFIILLFGEILPKIYANRNNLKFASLMALPLTILNKGLTFLNEPMQYATTQIENHFGKSKSDLNISQLSQALEITDGTETTLQEKKILESIVSFGTTEVREVMQPRMDIFSIKKEETFTPIIRKISQSGYSRVPIYQDSIDDVIGILYVKDLLPYLSEKNFQWLSLIQKPIFVPENKKLDDLLTEFQEKKNHLAVVVDEYGGTCGIITLDDIIRQIVGDISDEFDDEDIHYTKINDTNYIFEGRVHLRDFFKITKIEPSENFEIIKKDAETLAGFILEISNNFPKRSDKISFENLEFTIDSLDKKRIKKIKLTLFND